MLMYMTVGQRYKMHIHSPAASSWSLHVPYCSSSTAVPGTTTPFNGFLQGVKHHRQGRLEDAEQCYRTFLRSEPAHADCLHQLGALLVQKGGNKHVSLAGQVHPYHTYGAASADSVSVTV